MQLPYGAYLDKILGGWMGKSIGGTIGCRFEGDKRWIEIEPGDEFPGEIPPNDDLDLQVLWLKVLEEQGAALTSEDLAEAWLRWCWYPFCEYGNFRRNWRLGIHPPYSGIFNNEFYMTGNGCPIRGEIWGYVFPGAPALAARYAQLDGCLDHGTEAISGERFFAAMAAMAFGVSDIRALIEENLIYLPEHGEIRRLVLSALQSFDEGLDLRTARERLLLLRAHPEPCDALLNVAFTVLGLLYGRGDWERTIHSTLHCGYDTDCTLATAAAFLGQIMGASRIPERWKAPIGDTLVMGIEYRRKEMTLSALARDTARIGALLALEGSNRAMAITGAPALKPLPKAKPRKASLRIDYLDLPAAAPGESVRVQAFVHLDRPANQEFTLRIDPPPTFTVQPPAIAFRGVAGQDHVFEFSLRAREDVRDMPMKNLFAARLTRGDAALAEQAFGVAGAALWRLLGAHFDVQPPGEDWDGRYPIAIHHERIMGWRPWDHYHVGLEREYLANESDPDVDGRFRHCSLLLGRPAILAQKELRLRVEDLVGVQAEYCAYLCQDVVSPAERMVYISVGHNDGHRIYVNGEMAGESNEQIWWTPRGAVYAARFRKGVNRVVLKLLRRSTALEFSIGFKEFREGAKPGWMDWLVDLASVNPLAGTSSEGV
ncbi:MAG: ADP-ribosylglycohydrolase family protein [Candidatus Sumerlaeota bacterium]|nr:ADP-ribosylglycohydrolase family protein [Candidatus Sumerlaeota bacterium]